MNAINRIVVIGNGFDLAHKLPTKYVDFINWYWKQWETCLVRSENKVEDDGLISFRLKDEVNLAYWGLVWHHYYQTPFLFFDNIEKQDIIKLVKADDHVCDFKSYSAFFDDICTHVEKKGWVDIENEYYKALNNAYFDVPEKLNQEFAIVKLKLIEYLIKIQETKINSAIVNQSLKNKIFAPMQTSEIAISARKYLLNFLSEQYQGIHGVSYATIYDHLDLDGKGDKYQILKKFSEEYGKQIETFGFDSLVDDNLVPDELLYPNRLLLLNFNYTNTADLYVPQDERKCYWFPINHIHGKLENPESIIFGYGDELDDQYSRIEKLNNNEYLSNVKSIKYLESDNYRRMLSFIDSAPYQVYIMGHSCGNSDRTLLNTLFEHKNCISIKPFYYIKENGTDNYLEIVQNISRNFTDMKLMRDRVVNKTYCEPLL